ncbi:hypothetical protein JCM18920_3300 [Cutibacterium acnes JCM 18920]|nr:hypothetical protein JCM18920_3300 [Cutibacterium acnes JCM 18920]
MKSQAGGTILSNTIGVVGAVVGLLAIDRIGRRRMLIGPFWMQTAVLLIVGLWTDAPPWVLVVGLALFAWSTPTATFLLRCTLLRSSTPTFDPVA